jgi:putative transposase
LRIPKLSTGSFFPSLLERRRRVDQALFAVVMEAWFPYVFLDATYCKARVNRRVVSQAVVVATTVRADGWREVLGFAVGDSEDGVGSVQWEAVISARRAEAPARHGCDRPR